MHSNPSRRHSATQTAQKIQLAIRATPEQVWNALTDPAATPAYYLGFSADCGHLKQASSYRYTGGGFDKITGQILSVEPGRRLSTSFNGPWAPDVAALPESRVTFAGFDPFMPMPGVTFLSCTHDELPDSAAAADLEIGWVSILSGLKSVLETGTRLYQPAG
ncbi:uncharacterized protein YndB with AHSA1/START domain [Nakamurella sp. UYEF19]|uniref:SRPBCC domain-containing protein n=1 Tax=Nakamurella sp. UYEF19 TaxID=1756392 RepID=UPI0033956F7E